MLNLEARPPTSSAPLEPTISAQYVNTASLESVSNSSVKSSEASGLVAISEALLGGLKIVALGAAPIITPQASYFPHGSYRRGGWQSLPNAVTGGEFIPVMTMAVQKSLNAQEKSLLNLEPNWDGYGAEPLQPGIIKTLISEIRDAISGINTKVPELVPGADGTLQAEWYLPSVRVFYQISADRTRFLFVIVDSTGEEITYKGDDARQNLSRVVRAIKSADDRKRTKKSV